MIKKTILRSIYALGFALLGAIIFIVLAGIGVLLAMFVVWEPKLLINSGTLLRLFAVTGFISFLITYIVHEFNEGD